MQKKQDLSSFYSGDIVNLKILQSDWPKSFWSIFQELDFTQVRDWFKNTANNKNLLYRPNSEKNND